MRLIWCHEYDENGDRTFISGLYDQKAETVEHDGVHYGFINFNPITDKDRTVAMREPIGQIDASQQVLIAGLDENTLVAICETEGFDLNDRVKFLEMLEKTPSGGIVGKENPEREMSIGSIIERRLDSGVVKYIASKDNSVSDEPKTSRFYASRTEDRTGQYGDQGFFMMEVPAHHKSLDEQVVNRYFNSLPEDPTGMKGSSCYLPSETEKRGIPAMKMSCISHICRKTKTPHRYEYQSFSYYNRMSSKRFAGFYDESGEYKTEFQQTGKPPKPENQKGRLLKMARRLVGSGDTPEDGKNARFPEGDLACDQIRNGYSPKNDFDTSAPSI